MDTNVACFLRESNAIEKEYSYVGFEDSVVAWDYAVGNYGDLGVDYVCGVHKRLMNRLNPKIAGKLRRKNVCIVATDVLGDRRILEEFEARGNKGRLRKWCEDYYDVSNLEEMKRAHIEFEGVHPFLDGNGRVGRILYNVQRIVSGFDVRVFLEEERFEYYKWFDAERRDKDNIRLLKNI